MSERLRFAEAVCAGHPDRLADALAARIVELAVARDPDALVGVEVAVYQQKIFLDGRLAAGPGPECAVSEKDLWDLAHEVYRAAGYGDFRPHPTELQIVFALCRQPLPADERAIRHLSDDQSISVGYAVAGERAGFRPLEQALASDFARALERSLCCLGERGAAGLDVRMIMLAHWRFLTRGKSRANYQPQCRLFTGSPQVADRSIPVPRSVPRAAVEIVAECDNGDADHRRQHFAAVMRPRQGARHHAQSETAHREGHHIAVAEHP